MLLASIISYYAKLDENFTADQKQSIKSHSPLVAGWIPSARVYILGLPVLTN